MYTSPKFILLTLFLVFGFFFSMIPAKAQDSADSLQRTMMKDSLDASDSAITSVFSIRNNFLLRSDQITMDSTLNDAQKNSAMQLLATQTNEGIKNALGNTAYEHYTDMIRRRMTNRPNGSGQQPLASPNRN